MSLDSEIHSVAIYLSYEKFGSLRESGEIDRMIGRMAELGASLVTAEEVSAMIKITANRGFLSEEALQEIKTFKETNQLMTVAN